jgi:hypothetical protein
MKDYFLFQLSTNAAGYNDIEKIEQDLINFFTQLKAAKVFPTHDDNFYVCPHDVNTLSNFQSFLSDKANQVNINKNLTIKLVSKKDQGFVSSFLSIKILIKRIRKSIILSN